MAGLLAVRKLVMVAVLLNMSNGVRTVTCSTRWPGAGVVVVKLRGLAAVEKRRNSRISHQGVVSMISLVRTWLMALPLGLAGAMLRITTRWVRFCSCVL